MRLEVSDALPRKGGPDSGTRFHHVGRAGRTLSRSEPPTFGRLLFRRVRGTFWRVKPRSLLGFLIVAALAFGVYLWAKPHYESTYKKGKGHVPQTVVINMPNPGGG